eukprot:jgi/Chrzof1/10541/Cz05g02170.t1_MAPK2
MMLMQAAHGSGEYLLDDLQEIAVVGSGSSGVVKKVRHKATGQVFVLKVIQFDVNSEQLRRQVMTELKTLYGARHQHIVQYHQSYFANGAITILMEFMDAGTLFDLLQKVRRIPEPYLADLARQVLSGLSYLHKDLHIVHRDIKPSNLLLNSKGDVRISDFGVSGQLSNSCSKCLSWVGTVTYMSPERIRGDCYAFNTDVWSLGLVLLECAVGRFPYPPPGEAITTLGFWELLEYIVVEPAPRLPANQFSPELVHFIDQCLQKDAAVRATAPQLLQHPFLTKNKRVSLSDLWRVPVQSMDCTASPAKQKSIKQPSSTVSKVSGNMKALSPYAAYSSSRTLTGGTSKKSCTPVAAPGPRGTSGACDQLRKLYLDNGQATAGPKSVSRSASSTDRHSKMCSTTNSSSKFSIVYGRQNSSPGATGRITTAGSSSGRHESSAAKDVRPHSSDAAQPRISSSKAVADTAVVSSMARNQHSTASADSNRGNKHAVGPPGKAQHALVNNSSMASRHQQDMRHDLVTR